MPLSWQRITRDGESNLKSEIQSEGHTADDSKNVKEKIRTIEKLKKTRGNWEEENDENTRKI